MLSLRKCDITMMWYGYVVIQYDMHAKKQLRKSIRRVQTNARTIPDKFENYVGDLLVQGCNFLYVFMKIRSVVYTRLLPDKQTRSDRQMPGKTNSVAVVTMQTTVCEISSVAGVNSLVARSDICSVIAAHVLMTAMIICQMHSICHRLF